MEAHLMFLVTLVAAAVVSSRGNAVRKPARIVDPMELDASRANWLLWEDASGVVHNESLQTQRKFFRHASIADVKLRLYTRANPEDYDLIDPANLTGIRASAHFKATRHNVFIMHGWHNDGASPVNQLIKAAILDTHDVNVFVVDWSGMAGGLYLVAKAAIPGIGAALGAYIKRMLAHFHLSSGDAMLIGHSLGAHLAGVTGAAMGKPRLIVGLDPAGPLYSLGDLETRLDEGDAHHVQVIHTCGGRLALSSSLGHSDFYPNGGSRQPGCGLDILATCAHARAYMYYAESVRSCGFSAVSCASYDAFERRLCDGNANSSMGCFEVDVQATGDFFLDTSDEAPFVLQERHNLKSGAAHLQHLTPTQAEES